MILQLRYKKKLGYVGAKFLPRIPAHIVEEARHSVLVTFRKPGSGRADKVRKDVSALTRLTDLPGEDITFYGVQSDSPLAPLLIWDAAHHLPVGGIIRFKGDLVSTHQLERDYFKEAFTRIPTGNDTAVFRKDARLDAEKSDLDGWTFGIPVGPEDATLLNACVKRILELDVPRKEIVLCGRPADNFHYWDQVRIVGEDITAPPVQICKKKNRLAQEAKYENLCIIHDRVFLPLSFMAAVREFGNAYPLTAFQSIFFDDKWNLVPRRYSDFGVTKKIGAQTNLGLMREAAVTPSKYAPNVLPLLERSEFLFANPHRLARNMYPTGSLYLAKKSVWLRCPQNESLMWTEFEDVEHAERAAEMGIPSRVNPYAFTQSMISRPLLSVMGAAHIETRSGTNGLYRPLLEALPLPRKPLIKKTQEQATQDADRFAKTYAPDISIPSLSSCATHTRMRLRMMARVIHGARLPIRKDVVKRFILDFEKLIIGDQLPYRWREYIQTQFFLGGKQAITKIFEDNPDIFNHVAQRPRGDVYAKTLLDYLPEKSFIVRLGSLVSAILMGAHNHRAFVFPKGILWRYRAIMDSTPFATYADKEDRA